MHEEKYGNRDLTYSAWHRRYSIQRFVGLERAQTLSMIDVDVPIWCEYDNALKHPLGIIETARDVGQPSKCATVSEMLAKNSDIPCYVCLYKPADTFNPADDRYPDIESFRARRLWPKPERELKLYSPEEWAKHLWSLRVFYANRVAEKEHHRLQLLMSEIAKSEPATLRLVRHEIDRLLQDVAA